MSARAPCHCGRSDCPFAAVGALPGQAEAVSTADAYTYGATSQALAEGQAMAAWADLSAKQNSPKFTQATKSGLGCGGYPEFLLAPMQDGVHFTCVTRDGVHVLPRYASREYEKSARGYTMWFLNAEVVRYLQLNEPKAFAGSQAQYNDAVLRALRALRMTTAEYGWVNVRGQLRAAAWYYGGDVYNKDEGDVDEVHDKLVAAIGPYYDKDVASPGEAAKRRADVLASDAKSAYDRTHGGGPGVGAALAIGGAAMLGLSIWKPQVASRVWSGASGAASSLYRRIRAAAG